MASAGYLHLTRDLRPTFRERRGELAAHWIEASREVEGHVVERIGLRSTSGLEVALAVKRPAEKDSVPRPAVLLLGGHETGRDAVDLIADTRGIVVVTADYPLEGPRRIKGLKLLRAIPRIQRALVDTPPALQLAADWMLAQPFVDSERMELVGVSLGAPFACVAGGLDERFGRVWSVHGGGRLHRAIDHGLRSRVSPAPARRALSRLVALLGYGSSLAPETWVASIAPREFHMINALDDERIPRECVDALFDAAREPKQILWLPGGHVDPDRGEIVRALVRCVVDRIETDSPVPPHPQEVPIPDGSGASAGPSRRKRRSPRPSCAPGKAGAPRAGDRYSAGALRPVVPANPPAMITLRPSEERGHAEHGWLDTYHTFSFADYFDPRHVQFGVLRVINQDKVAPGRGFGTHAHRDMEIVTYVLEGALEHKDSMGNGSQMRPGEVQLMSAGTGVTHSEFNPSPDEPLHLLQMWVFPSRDGTRPRYEQKAFSSEERRGRLRLVVSPDGAQGSLTIGQDARLHAGLFDAGESARLPLGPERSAWVHVARGRVRVNGRDLGPGDGAGLSEEDALEVEGVLDAELVVWEMPAA